MWYQTVKHGFIHEHVRPMQLHALHTHKNTHTHTHRDIGLHVVTLLVVRLTLTTGVCVQCNV